MSRSATLAVAVFALSLGASAAPNDATESTVQSTVEAITRGYPMNAEEKNGLVAIYREYVGAQSAAWKKSCELEARFRVMYATAEQPNEAEAAKYVAESLAVVKDDAAAVERFVHALQAKYPAGFVGAAYRYDRERRRTRVCM